MTMITFTPIVVDCRCMPRRGRCAAPSFAAVVLAGCKCFLALVVFADARARLPCPARVVAFARLAPVWCCLACVSLARPRLFRCRPCFCATRVGFRPFAAAFALFPDDNSELLTSTQLALALADGVCKGYEVRVDAQLLLYP
jgi:hypothetical protein